MRGPAGFLLPLDLAGNQGDSLGSVPGVRESGPLVDMWGHEYTLDAECKGYNSS